MWAQQWDTIVDLVKPFPGKQSIDVTDELNAQVRDDQQNITFHYQFV